jgi:hypothetical protein
VSAAVGYPGPKNVYPACVGEVVRAGVLRMRQDGGPTTIALQIDTSIHMIKSHLNVTPRGNVIPRENVFPR